MKYDQLSSGWKGTQKLILVISICTVSPYVKPLVIVTHLSIQPKHYLCILGWKSSYVNTVCNK